LLFTQNWIYGQQLHKLDTRDQDTNQHKKKKQFKASGIIQLGVSDVELKKHLFGPLWPLPEINVWQIELSCLVVMCAHRGGCQHTLSNPVIILDKRTNTYSIKLLWSLFYLSSFLWSQQSLWLSFLRVRAYTMCVHNHIFHTPKCWLLTTYSSPFCGFLRLFVYDERQEIKKRI
jgi:hypothetical protein